MKTELGRYSDKDDAVACGEFPFRVLRELSAVNSLLYPYRHARSRVIWSLLKKAKTRVPSGFKALKSSKKCKEIERSIVKTLHQNLEILPINQPSCLLPYYTENMNFFSKPYLNRVQEKQSRNF